MPPNGPADPYDLLQQEIAAYRAALPSPDPTWPVEVRVFMTALNEYLFETGLHIGNLQRQCGLCDHNTSTCFAEYVGMTPKQYRLHHQMALAKLLLRDKRLKEVPIVQIVLAIGYNQHRVFTQAFKKHEGCTPLTIRVCDN